MYPWEEYQQDRPPWEDFAPAAVAEPQPDTAAMGEALRYWTSPEAARDTIPVEQPGPPVMGGRMAKQALNLLARGTGQFLASGERAPFSQADAQPTPEAPQFDIPPAETFGEKAEDVMGSLAGTIVELTLLGKMVPASVQGIPRQALVFEAQNQLQRGEPGHGAAMGAVFGAIEKLPVRDGFKMLAESGALGGLAAAEGGDWQDVVLNAAIPPGLRATRLFWRSKLDEAKNARDVIETYAEMRKPSAVRDSEMLTPEAARKFVADSEAEARALVDLDHPPSRAEFRRAGFGGTLNAKQRTAFVEHVRTELTRIDAEANREVADIRRAVEQPPEPAGADLRPMQPEGPGAPPAAPDAPTAQLQPRGEPIAPRPAPETGKPPDVPPRPSTGAREGVAEPRPGTIPTEQLSDVFGIEIEATPPSGTFRPPSLREIQRTIGAKPARDRRIGIVQARRDMLAIHNKYKDLIGTADELADIAGEISTGTQAAREGYVFTSRSASEAKEVRDRLPANLRNRVRVVKPGNKLYRSADGSDVFAELGPDAMADSIIRHHERGESQTIRRTVEWIERNPDKVDPDDLYQALRYRQIEASPETAKEVRGKEPETIQTDELAVGQEFEIANDRYVVKDVDPDTQSVTVKDDITLELPRGADLKIDKGSLTEPPKTPDPFELSAAEPRETGAAGPQTEMFGTGTKSLEGHTRTEGGWLTPEGKFVPDPNRAAEQRMARESERTGQMMLGEQPSVKQEIIDESFIKKEEFRNDPNQAPGKRPEDYEWERKYWIAREAKRRAAELSEDDFVELMMNENRKDMAAGNAAKLVREVAGGTIKQSKEAVADISPTRFTKQHYSQTRSELEVTAGVDVTTSMLPSEAVYRRAHQLAVQRKGQAVSKPVARALKTKPDDPLIAKMEQQGLLKVEDDFAREVRAEGESPPADAAGLLAEPVEPTLPAALKAPGILEGTARAYDRTAGLYYQQLLDRVGQQAGPVGKVVERFGRRAVRDAAQIEGRLADTVLFQMFRQLSVRPLAWLRNPGAQLEAIMVRKSLSVLEPVPGAPGMFESRGQRLIEDPRATGATPAERRLFIDPYRKMLAASAAEAQAIGVKRRAGGAVQLFQGAVQRDKFLRNMTPELHDIYRRQGGEYEHLRDGLARMNGMTVKEASEALSQWLGPQATRVLGSFERARAFKRFPVAMEYQGRTIPLLEYEPVASVRASARNMADRLAFIKHFGQDLDKPHPRYERMRRQFVQRGGHEQDFDNLIASLNNRPLSFDRFNDYGVRRSIPRRLLTGVAVPAVKGAMQSLSAVVNVPELVSKVPAHAGIRRTVRGLGQAVVRAHKQPGELRRIGALTSDFTDWYLQKSRRIEQLGRAIYETELRAGLSHYINEFNEYAAASIGKLMAADLKAGRAQLGDVNRLRALKFDARETRDLLSGTAPEALYNELARRVAAFTQGSTLRRAETSRAAQSPTFRFLFWFQRYTQITVERTAAMNRELGRAMRTGDPKQMAGAVKMMAEYLGGHALAGTAAILLTAWIKKQQADLGDGWQEAVMKAWTNAGLSGPLRTLEYIDPGRGLPEAAAKFSPLARSLNQVWYAVHGLGRYRGKSLAERTAEYLRSVTPATQIRQGEYRRPSGRNAMFAN